MRCCRVTSPALKESLAPGEGPSWPWRSHSCSMALLRQPPQPVCIVALFRWSAGTTITPASHCVCRQGDFIRASFSIKAMPNEIGHCMEPCAVTICVIIHHCFCCCGLACALGRKSCFLQHKQQKTTLNRYERRAKQLSVSSKWLLFIW